MIHLPDMVTVVFAKVPGMGIAKQRIAAQSDRATAERVYGELLAVTARVLQPLRHCVAFTGADTPGALETVFPHALEFFAQQGDTLGNRLQAATYRLLDRGATGVCAVGCDCPSMSAADIEQAALRLRESDSVVLGPAADGGYYLAACHREGAVIYDAQGWSTPRLLQETTEILKRNQLRYSLLQPRTDIDTLEDYHQWQHSRRSAAQKRSQLFP